MESIEGAIMRIKKRIDHRLNDLLVKTKPGYDDSITGINEAWAVVTTVLYSELEKLQRNA